MRCRKATARKVCSRSTSRGGRRISRLALWKAARLVGSVGGVSSDDKAPTSVSLFDQGLTQIFQASVTGLQPKMPYVLALSSEPNGRGKLEVIASFMTNPAGSAIVNTVGPIRQIVQGEQQTPRRYLAIAEGHSDKPGAIVQVQLK